MEARLLLAAAIPIITEFLASSDEGLADQDGAHPDWIEVHNPTGSSINQSGALGRVADTNFSVNRGFYDQPLDVVLTTSTGGAEIRYTLDGTNPTETTGLVYQGPIHITKTMTLKAAAFKPGYTATDVDAQTYLFLDNVLTQNGAGLPTTWGSGTADYAMDSRIVTANIATIRDDLRSLPVVSLSMPINDWFAAQGGIYPQGNGDPRQTSMEFFTADGTEQVQINGSVEVQGGGYVGTSAVRWKSYKLSLQLKFKEIYGDAKLNAPLFGAGATDRFDTLILDAQINHTWLHPGADQQTTAKLIQDQYMADVQNAMGGYGPHGRFVHLYLNGLYWGVYDLHERPDEKYAEEYLGGDASEYVVIKNRLSNPSNDPAAGPYYQSLLSIVRADMSNVSNYRAVENVLDVDEFIDYMLVNFYGGNHDWAHKNWYATFNTADSNGKWRFHSWDAEHVLEDVNANVTTYNNSGAPTEFHTRLRTSPEYRIRFADRVRKHFFDDGAMTPGRMAAMYQERMSEVDRAMVAESARWGDNRSPGDPYTREDWLATQEGLLANYFPGRTAALLGQLRSQGLYPSVEAPGFSSTGGAFGAPQTLTMTNPAGAGTIYYTTDGSDPRGTGGAISPAAKAYSGPVVVSSSAKVCARVFGAEWSAQTEAIFHIGPPPALRITEIMYHPVDAPTGSAFVGEDFEFIELWNASGAMLNVGGYRFTNGIKFEFPAGTVFAANERVILAKSAAAFALRYGSSIELVGVYGGRLDNAGDRLTLVTQLGQVVQSIEYGGNWWAHADGGGFSLTAVDPLASDAVLSTMAGWRPSGALYGSPGAEDPGLNPSVSRLAPDPLLGAAARQWLTLHGTGFSSDFSVLFCDETNGVSYPEIVDPARRRFVSSGEVQVYAGVGVDAAVWSVRVRSGGKLSEPLQFEVGAGTGVLRAPGLVEPGDWNAPGAVIGESAPVMRWEGVPGALGYGLYVSRRSATGDYELVFDSQARGIVIPGDATSFALPAGVLAQPGLYRWNMNTRNPAGWGAYSPRRYLRYTTSAAPQTPTGLAVEPEGPVMLEVWWNASAGAERYKVYRSTSEDGPWQTELHVGTAIRFVDSATEPGRTYWYRVAAANLAGDSPLSPARPGSTAAMPQPPAAHDLSAEVQEDGSVLLEWAGDLASGKYIIERADSENSAFYPLEPVPFSQHTYVDTRVRMSTPTVAPRYRLVSSDDQSPFAAIGGAIEAVVSSNVVRKTLEYLSPFSPAGLDYTNVAKLLEWDWSADTWKRVETLDAVEWGREKTVILTHGWNGGIEPWVAGNGKKPWEQLFGEQFEHGPADRKSRYNLLAVDWNDNNSPAGSNPNGAGLGWDLSQLLGLPDAIKSAENGIAAAGAMAAKLLAAQARPESMMLVGFSNGAGFMGSLADSMYQISGTPVKELVSLDAPFVTASYAMVQAAAKAGAAEHVTNITIPFYHSKILQSAVAKKLDILLPSQDRIDQNVGFGAPMLFGNVTNLELNNAFRPESWRDYGLLDTPDMIDHFKVPFRYAETAGVGGTWGFSGSSFVTGHTQYDGGFIWFETSTEEQFLKLPTTGEMLDAAKEGIQRVAGYAWSMAETGAKKIGEVAAGAWKGVNGAVDVAGSGASWLYGAAADAWPFSMPEGMTLAAEPGAEAYSIQASIDVQIPADGGWLGFDLTVLDPGNDDRLYVLIGDEVVGQVNFTGASLAGGREIVLWIGEHAGEATTLHFCMPSEVSSSAEFYIGNIAVYPYRQPLAPVVEGKAAEDNAFRVEVDASGTMARVLENDAPAQEYALAELDALTLVNGGAGGMLTLDLTHGVAMPPEGLFFQSIAGAALRVIGGGREAALTLRGRWSELMVGGRSLYFERVELGAIQLEGFANVRLALEEGAWSLERAWGAGDVAVNVGEATLTIGASQAWSELVIGNEARVSVTPGAGATIRASSLNIDEDGAFDLADNTFIWTCPPDDADSAAWHLGSRVSVGRGGGLGGIVSSVAPADGGRKALGVAVSAEGAVVKLAWNGDVDLSGLVDGDDYAVMDHGFIQGDNEWRYGDVDYNGIIDADDYFLIDSSFLAQERLRGAAKALAVAPAPARAVAPPAAVLRQGVTTPFSTRKLVASAIESTPRAQVGAIDGLQSEFGALAGGRSIATSWTLATASARVFTSASLSLQERSMRVFDRSTLAFERPTSSEASCSRARRRLQR